MDTYALDDIAALALWPLIAETREHVGLLYEDGGLRVTPTQSQDRRGTARGSFSIPPGSLRAIYHNHPMTLSAKKNRNRSEFSPEDIAQARQLGVPSYIAAGHKLRRYDPSTGKTEDVLAEIPVDLIAAYFRSRLLGGDSGVP